MTAIDAVRNLATYGPHDLARVVTEPPKGEHRRAFERDRARVLHSAALRRLAAKTQVHSVGLNDTAGVDDFPRTRLTHSLEVAQIGREMGARLGCDPDIVDAAGLAHDLGHPPFGHNGEESLDEVAAACGGFEGNAQTLRVLTRLEAKVLDAQGRGVGLNLTRAVLDAACKYPWPREHPAQRKFGVYADDSAVFDWLREGAPDRRRCLEAQVMDWADDVAYSVHDVEDGVFCGYVTLARLADAGERVALCEQVATVYSAESPGDLAAVLDELLADPMLGPLSTYDGTYRAQVALKQATSMLIGRFVAAAVAATRVRYGEASLHRYAADLVVPRRTRAECALLKGVALRYVMLRPGQEARYERQREVLRELVWAVIERAPDALDAVYRPRYEAAVDDATRLRSVIDQVAGLTDASAVALHRRLTDRR